MRRRVWFQSVPPGPIPPGPPGARAWSGALDLAELALGSQEVLSYQIADFSRWKDHDSFDAAFDRLLKDLKTDE
jgi:hypothetical protein